jgi:hypothetical protein
MAGRMKDYLIARWKKRWLLILLFAVIAILTPPRHHQVIAYALAVGLVLVYLLWPLRES